MFEFVLSGSFGVRTRLVRRLPGPLSLPQEQPNRRDKDCHPVPLPLLAGLQHSNIHQSNSGVPKVSFASCRIVDTKMFRAS